MRRRTLTTTIAAAALTVGLAAPQVAQSAPKADPRAEREQVRAERAQVASQIDTSKASMAEIDEALTALREDLQTQEAALAKAEADVAQAEKDIADAEAAIKRLTSEIALLLRRDARGGPSGPSSAPRVTPCSGAHRRGHQHPPSATARSTVEMRSRNDLGGEALDMSLYLQTSASALASATSWVCGLHAGR